MGLAVVVSKSASILTQLALGYLFIDEQFGQIAFLVGGMALVSGFMDTGVSKLLIRAQDRINEYRASALFVCLSLALSGSAFLLIYIFRSEMPHEVGVAALLIAATIPVFSLAQINKARLSVALDIPYISRVEVQQTILYSAIFISLAFAGYGVEGFGVATSVGYLFTAYKYHRRVKNRRLNLKAETDKSITPFELLKELRWLILTTFAMGFALRGDYVVLSGMVSISELGVYYFAFMLTANIGLLIAAGVNTAFMPYLAKKLDSPNLLKEFFLKNSFMFMYLSALVAGLFICLGGWAVSLVWQGRWDVAVWPATVLAVSLPLKMLAPISYALLEAKGMWKERFMLVVSDAITVAIAVYLGARADGLIGSIMFIAIQRALIGYVIFQLTCKLADISLNLMQSTIPILILTGLVVVVLALNEFTSNASHGFAAIIIVVLSCIILNRYVPVMRPGKSQSE